MLNRCKISRFLVAALLAVTASGTQAAPPAQAPVDLDSVMIGAMPLNTPADVQQLQVPERQLVLRHMLEKGLLSADEYQRRIAKLKAEQEPTQADTHSRVQSSEAAPSGHSGQQTPRYNDAEAIGNGRGRQGDRDDVRDLERDRRGRENRDRQSSPRDTPHRQ
jgi:uncharacterized small protein (DUF1192 family)